MWGNINKELGTTRQHIADARSSAGIHCNACANDTEAVPTSQLTALCIHLRRILQEFRGIAFQLDYLRRKRRMTEQKRKRALKEDMEKVSGWGQDVVSFLQSVPHGSNQEVSMEAEGRTA
jgi:hypothetical protein